MTSPRSRQSSLNAQVPQIQEEDNTESFRHEIDKTLGTATSRLPRNAFAEESLRVHRHRLAGNAFYQEQFSKRKLTPPTVLHPAFRYNTDLYNISEPLPELDFNAANGRPSFKMEELSPRHAREHRNTTMSAFIDGVEHEVLHSSPPLKLAPSPSMTGEPTMRNELEQRLTTVGDETITVFRPSPNVVSRDFGHHSQQFENTSTNKSPTSPKKSLLDRFRVGNRRGGVPLKLMPPINVTDGLHNMPAKARAVLVAPPPSRTVVRSPSKTKGLWFRRKPSISEDSELPAVAPVLKEPPRDPHPVYTSNARTRGLGYMDNSVPPTPPAKDTPPEEKVQNDVVIASLVSYEDGTPTRKTGSVSLTSRTSPSKIPKLVAQPSTRSLQASVVPATIYADEYQVTRARIDGLGLANFSLPAADCRKFEQYSPSVYSPDREVEHRATFPPVAAHEHQRSKSISDTDISDMASYPMIYPDLSRNPSIKSFATPPNKCVYDFSDSGASGIPYGQHLRRERRPTIRRDELDIVIHEVKGMMGGREPSPSQSSLFAIPLGHASAQVSPLHLQPAAFEQYEGRRSSPDLQPILRNGKGEQILPATTYNPGDAQQQSNRSPIQDYRFAGVGIARATKGISTHAMPGLEYDSGIDVDPKKSPARTSKTSGHQHSTSAPSTTAWRSQKHIVRTDPRTGSPQAAGQETIDNLSRRDSRVKQVISSAEIGKRLSDIEEKMKQEFVSRSVSDVEERRRFEQEVMFDYRIASLEIERFSCEPSPTNSYEIPEMTLRHDSHRLSSSPFRSTRERQGPRHPHRLSSPYLPPDLDDDRSIAKRVSTGEAREFYQCQLRDSPISNMGKIDTSTRHRKGHNSSPSSRHVQMHAPPDAIPHVPDLVQESEKIRQLQWKVERQNEWIQEMMASMKAIEADVAVNRDQR